MYLWRLEQVLFVFERRDLCDSHNGERLLSNTHRLSPRVVFISYFLIFFIFFHFFASILTETYYFALCILYWSEDLCVLSFDTLSMMSQESYFTILTLVSF